MHIYCYLLSKVIYFFKLVESQSTYIPLYLWQINTPRNSVLLLLPIDFNARMKRYRILYLAKYVAPQLRVVVAAWRLKRPDEKTS